MSSPAPLELLKDPRAKEEIERHRWIESEKAGCDIGFERASAEWINKFSSAWIKYHMGSAAVPKRSAKRIARK